MLLDKISLSLSQHWQTFDYRIALLLIVAYIVIDIIYTHNTTSIVEKKATKAANTSAMLYLLSSIGVLNYVDNYLYVAPLIFGAWVGTYVAVNRNSQKKSLWFRIKK